MSRAGISSGLFLALTKSKIPTHVLCIHALDGFDLLGGWSLYNKILELKSNTRIDHADLIDIQSEEEMIKKFAGMTISDMDHACLVPIKKLYSTDLTYPESWIIYMNF